MYHPPPTTATHSVRTGPLQVRGLLAGARRALRELQPAKDSEVVLAAGIEVGDQVELVSEAVLERLRREAAREWMPMANLEPGPLHVTGATGVVTEIIQGVFSIPC